MSAIVRAWYQRYSWSVLLWPLSLVYRVIVSMRRWAFQSGLLNCHKLPVPVIVVGNITVGGTGKTPLVIFLLQWLKGQGYKPGVISRGYKGQASSWPQRVEASSDPTLVGDEPVLIAQQSHCPVVVGPNRVEAGQLLLADFDCDIIIADDGLQHYRLARDIEIAVIDGERQLGNRLCLPAGPLRESVARLQSVDLVISNGAASRYASYCMQAQLNPPVNLVDRDVACDWSALRRSPVHAVCAIGHPERFFQQLRALGLRIIPHAFPDHHIYTADDFSALSGPVIMTEKDAIKCRSFVQTDFWSVGLSLAVDHNFLTRLRAQISQIKECH